ncbi:MAG: signal peptidase II [Bacteroidetes bacterium]|nr:signal peptidase II [Bacteroidota bacterium]
METPNKWKTRSTVIVLAVICIDQITKAIVLNTMQLGQSIPLLGDWLRFTFTENPGMAFGIRFGPPAMITIFSIIATFLIILYLYKIGSIYGPYRASLSFVLGGAVGNIIDRVFFGKLLYDEPLFLGRVVDFIHINVWKGYLPDGIPLIGGNYMALFPIWNVADMSIVLGVVGIIFFQKKFHEKTIALEGGVPNAAAGPGPIVDTDPTTSASTELPGQTSSDA